MAGKSISKLWKLCSAGRQQREWEEDEEGCSDFKLSGSFGISDCQASFNHVKAIRDPSAREGKELAIYC